MDALKEVVIRDAIKEDIPFIVEAIIEAEKSGTKVPIMSKYFEIDEEELKQYLLMALEENVDGCELSLSSFIVAECNGIPISTYAGWVEGIENGIASDVLKSNLLFHVLPRSKILDTRKKLKIVKDLHIDRPIGTYQLEYGYTKPEYRGMHVLKRVIGAHLDRALRNKTELIQNHVLASNAASIKSMVNSGFLIKKCFYSNSPMIFDVYPCNVMLLFEKRIGDNIHE